MQLNAHIKERIPLLKSNEILFPSKNLSAALLRNLRPKDLRSSERTARIIASIAGTSVTAQRKARTRALRFDVAAPLCRGVVAAPPPFMAQRGAPYLST
ncbi:MAG: hypothetical protein ACOYM3_05225 [Terrimicrobiaceae bacterium]